MERIGLMMLAFVAMLGCADGARTDQPHHRVTTMQVGAGVYTSAPGGELSLPGVIKEARSVKAAFKSAGQLEQLLVKEGDYVRKGQLLARLDASDYQLGVDAVEAQYEQVSHEVGRIRELYKRGSVAANEYEKAEAGLAQLKVQLQAKQNQVAYTQLYAPASGYIEQIHFHKGEMVDAGTPLLTLIDTSEMQVEVSVPADLYRDREALSQFATRVDGVGYDLTLSSITPKTDGTQMYRMLLSLPSDRKFTVSSGRNVEVTMHRGAGTEAATSLLCVPVTALVYDADGAAYVWVVGLDATVSRRAVRLGTVDTQGNAQVVDGLQAGETIVKAGASYLTNGEQVEVIAAPAATNPGGLL